MVHLFRTAGDIYQTLAGFILDKPPQTVTPEERVKAKVICLGLMYGMGPQVSNLIFLNYAIQIFIINYLYYFIIISFYFYPQAAAAKLSIDIQSVHQILNQFHRKFSSVKKWINDIKR
jgi:DNA polymerase I-like protein with 3'-5' exonuclease and polymerase domains